MALNPPFHVAVLQEAEVNESFPSAPGTKAVSLRDAMGLLLGTGKD